MQLCISSEVKGNTGAHPHANDFIAPLDIPLRLSGSFGELRGTHFHAGLDFRTYGREGFPVKAAASGYVSRISVSPTGYGKALYLTHDSGLKTVYAHLKSFTPQIEHFVRKEQYRKERFQVRIHPSRRLFRVEQGEIIGYSGNTGSSQAPHLHFEIRDASTQSPVNPGLFNLPVKDPVPPVIKGLRIHPLSDQSLLRVQKNHPQGAIRSSMNQPYTINTLKQGTDYVLRNTKQILLSGPTGFSVETIDRQKPGANRLGVHSIRLEVNGETIYHHRKDTFSFSQTRFIQAHIDWQERVNNNRNFQRSFLLPFNELPFYQTVKNGGVIGPEPGEKAHAVYTIKDVYGNTSQLRFHIKGVERPVDLAEFKPVYDKLLLHDRPGYFRNEELELVFPANTFYDTVRFTYLKEKPEADSYSSLHRIHHPGVPVHNHYTMRIDAGHIPETYREHAYIARRMNNGRDVYVGGSYSDGKIHAQIRSFGLFHIKADTTGPSITPLNFNASENISTYDQLRIKIHDPETGIDSYRPEINGRWALMEYDAKNDMLIYNIDDKTPEGKLQLNLDVTNRAGITSSREMTLYNR